MQEIVGDIWEYYGKPGWLIFITTNGTVKKNGAGVMGRGTAFQAKQRFPTIDFTLGQRIRLNGNVVDELMLFNNVPRGLPYGLYRFPVKHEWWEKADLVLITVSSNQLLRIALANTEMRFVITRPGCGNGRRTWDEIKPIMNRLPDNVLVISPPETK